MLFRSRFKESVSFKFWILAVFKRVGQVVRPYLPNGISSRSPMVGWTTMGREVLGCVVGNRQASVPSAHQIILVNRYLVVAQAETPCGGRSQRAPVWGHNHRSEELRHC